jgi:SAM-dependent methyltransferase
MMSSHTNRPDYGLDAPPVIRNLALAGAASLTAGLGAQRLLVAASPLLAGILLGWGLLAGASLLITAGLMVWSSRFGKLRERERLIDSLALRGHEHVLDVGVGRGLLLIAAARRLTTGTATGLDLWRQEDQAGNDPAATLANAQAEGVAGRVKLETGDMRQMPFDDATFDVVVSSLALHNIPDMTGRSQALHEIARVLKPGGHVALLDFQHTREYAQVLRELRWANVELSGLHFLMFPPVRVVTASKPINSK